MYENASVDRVRANTAPAVNRNIDRQLERSLRYFSNRSKESIHARIRELDEEWDIERALETMASSLSISGILLGVTTSRRWLLLPTAVLSFLLLHALQGWCPPVPLLRRLGVRTRQEIDRERYALKVMAGDFAAAAESRDMHKALAAVQ